MKTIHFSDEVDNDISPTKIYILVGCHMEYNDFTYDMWGNYINTKQFYSSKEEALSQYVTAVIEMYGMFRVYEIEEHMHNLDDPIAATVLSLNSNSTPLESEMTIFDFIEALQTSYNVSDQYIYDIMKDLLVIVKMEK